MLRALVWSFAAWASFAALQVYGIRRQGLGWGAVWHEAPSWTFVFLVSFPFFYALAARKKPDLEFAGLPLGHLPGAQRSLPSLLYVLALPVSLGVGSVFLYVIGEGRFRENYALMIGGFMAGCSISMVAICAAIATWAARRRAPGDTASLFVLSPGLSSLPSLLALPASAGVSGLFLHLVGEDRFQQDERLVTWGFMAAFAVSLVALNAAIARLGIGRGRPSSGRAARAGGGP